MKSILQNKKESYISGQTYGLEEHHIYFGTGKRKISEKNGFKVSGFDAYVSTNVIAAAGVSSSASFEMLICTIIDYFFNDSKMSYND